MRSSQVCRSPRADFRVGPLKTHMMKTSRRAVGSRMKSGRSGRRLFRSARQTRFHGLAGFPLNLSCGCTTAPDKPGETRNRRTASSQ
jgi:hypothetical protein